MPGEKLRVGVVGCGRRGRGHMAVVDTHDLATVAAVCDPYEDSRLAAAEQFGAEPYSDAAVMVERAKLDAVVVAAPAHLNKDAALPVIASGMTTLLEKPPGLTVADVREMQNVAERSGARVMVGFDRRFNPYVRHAFENIRQRGELRQLVAEFHKDIRDWTEDARFDTQMLEVLMLESPIHSIDLITHLADSPVKRVSSSVKSVNSPYRDVHAALIEFESGCVAQFTAILTAGGRLERYELHGNGISAHLEGVQSGTMLIDRVESAIPAAGDGITSTYLQDDFFLQHVASGEAFGEPAATLESSLATLDLAERIYSGEIQRPGYDSISLPH